MSNWDDVSALQIEFAAKGVSVTTSILSHGILFVRAESANVQQIVESIGPETILNGIGYERVRDWLDEQ